MAVVHFTTISCEPSTAITAGLEKSAVHLSGQVDFPVRQVTFHSHLPNGQWPRQVICQLNCKKSNLRLAQGKQNLRASCPKVKLEFKFFSSPGHLGTLKAILFAKFIPVLTTLCMLHVSLKNFSMYFYHPF